MTRMWGRRALVLIAAVSVLTFGEPVVPAPAAVAYQAPPCNTTGSPTTTVYLPNITKTLGGPLGWVTPFIVQNVGFYATTLEVSFYRFSDGALVTCRKIQQLQPSRSFADVPNNDADLPGNTQFAVVVRSFGSEVVAVINEQAGSGDRAEALAYDGLSSGALRVGLPYVAKNAGGWLSTVIVQNVGTAPASVTASFVSLDGARSASISRVVAAGRSSFIDPRSEPSLADATEYSVIVTSSSAVGVVVNSHNDTADVLHPRAFAYNGFPVAEPRLTFLPVVARNAPGSGRTSRLIVQNAGSGNASPNVQFSRFGDGAPADMRPPSALAPGRSWSFSTTNKADDRTACPTSGASDCISEGEHGASISNGTYAALDILLSPTTAMAYVAAPTSQSRTFLPNITRTLGGSSGWTTPIVIQRPQDGPTSASLRWFRFSDGQLVTQQRVELPIGGSSVRVDPRTVPGLSDNTQYAVVLDGKGPLGAVVEEIALSGGANAMLYPGFSSLVQAISVPAVIAPSPSTVIASLGQTLQLTATVMDQFDSPADGGAWPLSWSVSPASLGTITSSGSFTARGYGSGKIVATAGAASTTVPVTVQSPPSAGAAVSVPAGYSTQTVPTARGTFTAYVIKQPLSQVRVRTNTANASDCVADCPAQPLVEHLNQTGSFAGMNGTYFCPPDYSSCAAQLNYYDYAVYSSALGQWINEWALVSPTNSLVTVVGGRLRFYQHTYDYDRGAVDAAISNFPMLLLGGQVVDSSAIQTDYQKQPGYKGHIGTDGINVYLALVPGASVTDSAYVAQALGETDAMNLDGGGSSALFFDREYKVGPGRQLPNAVMLALP